jgi:cycloartenol synthase
LQGYNGSQLWDTSFAVQAMLDTGLTEVAAAALRKAHSYIEQSQVRRCCWLCQQWACKHGWCGQHG